MYVTLYVLLFIKIYSGDLIIKLALIDEINNADNNVIEKTIRDIRDAHHDSIVKEMCDHDNGSSKQEASWSSVSFSSSSSSATAQ